MCSNVVLDRTEVAIPCCKWHSPDVIPSMDPRIPDGSQALQTFSGQENFFPLCRCFMAGNFLLSVSDVQKIFLEAAEP